MKEKVSESHVVSPHCAGKFILFYPSTRLVVATCEPSLTHLANQLSKKTTDINASWAQTEKKL